MASLPIEILDLIVGAAVEDTSTRTVFGVTFAPELVALLKAVALVCHQFRERAQRHLFHEIRLDPFGTICNPVATERPLSIFEDNPRLLTYPRSLAVACPERVGFRQSELHFPSVTIFRFFASKLRNLDHLCISFRVSFHWPKVPSKFKDTLVRCITENRLKTLTIRRLSLPQDLVKIFPPNLEALDIEGDVTSEDSGFTAKYVKARSSNPTARPTHIAISGSWLSKQADDLFTRLKSLNIKVSGIPSLATILSSMSAYRLTNLSLRHQEKKVGTPFHPLSMNEFKMLIKISMKALRARIRGLQSATLPFMPCLEELNITVIVETHEADTCPVEAVAIAGAYIVPAFKLIH
jgi:hypothetical protein